MRTIAGILGHTLALCDSDLIFVTNGHQFPGPRPIYAIRPGGRGAVKIDAVDADDVLVWRAEAANAESRRQISGCRP